MRAARAYRSANARCEASAIAAARAEGAKIGRRRLSTIDFRLSTIEAAHGARLLMIESRPLNVEDVILMVEAQILMVEARKKESFDFRLSTIDYR